MGYENVLLINNRVVVNGETYNHVQLSSGVCYGCEFDNDNEINCDHIPEEAKKLCLETGSIWVKEEV